MYFGFAQPFFQGWHLSGLPLCGCLSPLEHPHHSSMGCECSLQQASTILLSHVDFRKAVCERHAGNWYCTSWVEGRWLSPHLHHQWKGFAMTTSPCVLWTCICLFSKSILESVYKDLFVVFLCCLFAFHLNSVYVIFPLLSQPHSRQDIHLQTGWHCNGGSGFWVRWQVWMQESTARYGACLDPKNGGGMDEFWYNAFLSFMQSSQKISHCGSGLYWNVHLSGLHWYSWGRQLLWTWAMLHIYTFLISH